MERGTKKAGVRGGCGKALRCRGKYGGRHIWRMNGLNRLFVKRKQGTKKAGVRGGCGKALPSRGKYGGAIFDGRMVRKTVGKNAINENQYKSARFGS